jgi:hypothetical protein
MIESDDLLKPDDLSQQARRLFVPLREGRGAAFVYGLLDHRVHDANVAAESLWAFAHDEFVGRSDGVARLWVNPLDWQRHGEAVRQQGVCLGLSTRLRGWDGRLTRCWVSSLRLIVGVEPVVVCYARPVAGSRGAVIDPEDLAGFAALLNVRAAQPLRGNLTLTTQEEMLLNPLPTRISAAR